MSDDEMSPELLAEAREDIADTEDFIQVMASGVRAFARKHGDLPRETTIGSLARVIPNFLNEDGVILLAAVAMNLLAENPPSDWPETEVPPGWPL